MKTITIKQPWAQLICEGLKDIENRTWPTKYRGRVLIHAALDKHFDKENAFTKNKILDDEKTRFIISQNKELEIFGAHLPYGAIVGSVEIVDCVINHPSIWAEKTPITDLGMLKVQCQPNIYNWVLVNPILFPEPISAKGKLSFWDYPNILAESEEEGGELFCHCQLGVDERTQV